VIWRSAIASEPRRFAISIRADKMHEHVDLIPLDLNEYPQFLARELNVELHSAELKKELSLPNRGARGKRRSIRTRW